jgi:hypothetical protein
MAIKNTPIVGTVGYGVFRSENDGKDWDRSNFATGLPFGTRVYYLVSHPRAPEVVFAGTDYGLACSDDAGRRWQILDNPLQQYAVWALAIDPEAMFAGTSQGFLFRSTVPPGRRPMPGKPSPTPSAATSPSSPAILRSYSWDMARVYLGIPDVCYAAETVAITGSRCT